MVEVTFSPGIFVCFPWHYFETSTWHDIVQPTSLVKFVYRSAKVALSILCIPYFCMNFVYNVNNLSVCDYICLCNHVLNMHMMNALRLLIII